MVRKDGTDDSGEKFAMRRESIQPLVVVVCSMSAGIIADRVLATPIAWWWSLSVLGWCGWWLAMRQRRDRTAAALLLTSVLALAGAWHHWCWHLFAANDLGLSAREAGQPVTLPPHLVPR